MRYQNKQQSAVRLQMSGLPCGLRSTFFCAICGAAVVWQKVLRCGAVRSQTFRPHRALICIYMECTSSKIKAFQCLGVTISPHWSKLGLLTGGVGHKHHGHKNVFTCVCVCVGRSVCTITFERSFNRLKNLQAQSSLYS